jgi:hypothetical protein
VHGQRHKTGAMIHNLLSEHHALKGWWFPKNEQLMEDWFADERFNIEATQVPFSELEAQMEIKVRRAIANYVLLLDEVGTKLCGPESPNEYAQLVKWCSKKTPHTKMNKIRLAAQPIVYNLLDKPIELVREVKEGELPEKNESDRTVKPHPRRGFYKMQPYGPKQSLRKRIRIPATIVNKHLLISPLTAVYKT